MYISTWLCLLISSLLVDELDCACSVHIPRTFISGLHRVTRSKSWMELVRPEMDSSQAIIG